MIIFCISCASDKDDIKYQGYDYVVVDTLHISRNGFDVILHYNIIIEMDSNYYSALMNTDGIITSIDRKLNNLNACQ